MNNTLKEILQSFIYGINEDGLPISTKIPVAKYSGYIKTGTSTVVTITGKGKIFFYSSNSGGNADYFGVTNLVVDGVTMNGGGIIYMSRTGRFEIPFTNSVSFNYTTTSSTYGTTSYEARLY